MSSFKTATGLTFGILAFLIWGLLPIYFKLLEIVPPIEILAHRIVWGVLFLTLLLILFNQLEQLKEVILNKKTLTVLTLSSLLITANYLIFIWGVTHEKILETSLGYFISPLLNILLGFLFLKEKLSPVKWIAVLLATSAVAYQVFILGSVPWVALGLALSFGLYSMVRKTAPAAPLPGLMVESLVLLPVALGYLFWLGVAGKNHFTLQTIDTSVLLSLLGVVAIMPLILFSMAAQKLNLGTLGILQYIAPSLSFTVGVVLYSETVTQTQMVTFSLIWIALILFSWDGFRQKRTTQQTSDKLSLSVEA